jgi:hypothetical protein
MSLNNPVSYTDPTGLQYSAAIIVTPHHETPEERAAREQREREKVRWMMVTLSDIRSTFDVANARQFYSDASYQTAAGGNMIGSFAAESLLTMLPQADLGVSIGMAVIPGASRQCRIRGCPEPCPTQCDQGSCSERVARTLGGHSRCHTVRDKHRYAAGWQEP